MTIHAFTELHSNFPAFINLSEQPDGTIKVSVRTRGNDGKDYAVITLTALQAEELADSIYKHNYKGEGEIDLNRTAAPVPASEAAKQTLPQSECNAALRPAPAGFDLSGVPSNELELALKLRKGPSFKCQSPDCRAYASSPGKWDTCPSCKRKGYLCGSFKENRQSAEWKAWEQEQISRFRAEGGNTNDTSTHFAAPAAPTDAKPECQAKLGEWSECQMRTIEAYNALQPPRQSAQSVRDAAYETAAKACEAWGNEKVKKWQGDPDMAEDAKARAWDALQCAAAIRALIQSPQAPGKDGAE